MLKISYELEAIKGEQFEWNLKILGISTEAWNKVIHRGIKPVKVFCHPDVLKHDPKKVRYYRMLAMVSQKSMSKIGLNINSYENGKKQFDDRTALMISRHLNNIISILIEHDVEVDEREFDLWRGMAAGSQAQGSWQNVKGSKAEFLIKDIIRKRIEDMGLTIKKGTHSQGGVIKLKDGRTIVMGKEPDIGIYEGDLISTAVEIKGGIDPAGVLERFGATLKSLRRVKQKNPDSTTVVIIPGVSLTSRAIEEINKSRSVIDYLFTLEDILSNREIRERLFKVLKI
ncbi:MAG: XcyI family restriction endonuclease [Thermotogae bacterium]|nr:XcyI family restriction endonuclease [Thermotogota bacterium]